MSHRLHASSRTLRTLTYAVWLTAPLGASARAGQPARDSNVPAFFEVRPGTTTRAEVDLRFGEAVRKPTAGQDTYEYAPPRGAADVDRVVVRFFNDTKQVARLDVYFKSPLPADPLRDQFGTRVLRLDRQDGGQDELFYPRLNGIVLAGKDNGAQATAVSYLSPRYLADMFVDRSNQARSEKRAGDAADEADKAVLVDPDYARGYIGQGLLLWDQKNYDEAVVRLVAATNTTHSASSNARAHVYLGVLYSSVKNMPDRARQEFQHALTLAPQLDFAHFEYGRFLRTQKLDDLALAEFRKAIELNDGHADARIALAGVLFDRRDYTAALPQFQRLAQWADSPTAVSRDAGIRSRMHFRYAYCLAETKQWDLAIAEYEKVLQMTPNNFDALNNLALAYQASEHLVDALDRFERGLTLAPKDLHLNWNFARALLAAGRYEDARRQAGICLELKPSDPEAALVMARSWAASKKKREALEWLRKALASGYRNRAELTTDPYFARLRDDREFKTLLAPDRPAGS